MSDHIMMEVECPHCFAKGQMQAPPPGAVIIGPCPRCTGMVVIFCGRALALDRDTMLEGSVEDKQAHLMTVLGEFLEERVEQIVNMISSVTDEDLQQLIDQEVVDHAEPMDEPAKSVEADPGLISDEEMARFLDYELPSIDDHATFRQNFGDS
jgi:hypothetical protein